MKDRRTFPVRGLLALLVFCAVIPTLVLGGLLIARYAHSERDRYEAQALEIAKQTALALDRDLVAIRTGLELLSANFPADRQLTPRLLAQLRQVEIATGAKISFVGSDGLAALSQDLPEGARITHALNGGRASISNLVRQHDGRWILIAAAPVEGAAGAVIAVLNPERLGRNLLRTDALSSWTLAMVDQQDRIIWRSRSSRRFVGSLATADLREHAHGLAGSWRGYTVEGEPVVAAYARSQISGYRIAVGAPESDIAAPLRQSLLLFGGAGLGLLLTALILGMWISRLISRPLVALTRSDWSPAASHTRPFETTVKEIALLEQILRTTSISLDREATERENAQAAVAESERRLLKLLDLLPVAVVETDASGTWTYANPAAAKLLEMEPSDMVGRPYDAPAWGITDASGKQLDSVDLPTARALTGERVIDFKHGIVHPKTGARKILSVNSVPMLGAEGEVTGSIAALVEVTLRVQAEHALRASEERLRDITDAMPALISYVDSDQRFRFVNKAYEDWFGTSRTSLVGRHLRDVMGELMYEARRPYVERALAGETVSYEVNFPHRTGPRPTVVQHVPHVGVDGQTRGMYALVQDVTELKRAEADLRNGETRLSAIFAQAKVGLSEVGLDGHFRRVNGELSRLLDRPREDLVSLHIRDVTHPDDVEVSFTNFRRALETGEAVSFDKRYVRPDGGIVWANSSLTRLDNADGTPSAVLAVTVDLTARHAQESALREETRTLDTLNQTGAAIAGELDLERLVQRVTDAGVELTGARFGAFFYNVLKEDGERLLLYTLSGAERSAFDSFGMPRATAVFGPTFRNEGTIRSDDILADPRYGRLAPHNGMPAGHLPVRSYLAVPVVSRTGEVIGGLFFGHPEPGSFSERHERLMAGVAAQAAVAIDNARLYQAVQRANETLEHRVEERTAERNRVWEMSRDLFAIMGFDGHLKAINPAWETTLGRDSETLLSLSFREQVHPEDHAAVEATMSRLLNGETVERFEDRLLHADGSWRWISWTLVPEGDVFYAVGRDVTPEKDAAAELAQAQEALRQSQKMEAMGQLTGGVAHDFNNLLTPIVGSLDMLMRRGLGNERERRLIDGAMQSAERAKTLVQRLLAFARRQPLQASAVDLAQLATGMAGLIESTLGPKIDIRLDLTGDLPPARADANQLEMALLNLAVNARDAMPDGGVLTISAARETARRQHRSKLKPGDYVRLSVADTGTGMDAETLRHAIEPFFSTKGIGKGTGLGLSMVHGLAAQLGGGLAITSEMGRGTTVELWLPISTEPLDYPPGEQQYAKSAEGRGRALLVDDEELVRMSTAGMLADLGFEVTEASSGEEALRLIDQGASPDLLVTDHLMPGMSGVDLAREVRLLKPGVPILIVSGYAEVEGIAPDLPRLTKPFRNAELADRLNDLGALKVLTSDISEGVS